MLQQLAPWFGYLATLLLALSLLVNNDLKFRWLNTGGTIAFIVYGLVIHAVPILLTNGLLLFINAYYLYKIYNRKEHFEIMVFEEGGPMVDRFISFYKEDIAISFPDFNKESLKENLNFLVLRDLVIANIFSAKVQGDGKARIVINYTVEKYRDYKVGRFIFDKEKDFLLSKGIDTLFYNASPDKRHARFLKVMGFTLQDINGQACLTRKL